MEFFFRFWENLKAESPRFKRNLIALGALLVVTAVVIPIQYTIFSHISIIFEYPKFAAVLKKLIYVSLVFAAVFFIMICVDIYPVLKRSIGTRIEPYRIDTEAGTTVNPTLARPPIGVSFLSTESQRDDFPTSSYEETRSSRAEISRARDGDERDKTAGTPRRRKAADETPPSKAGTSLRKSERIQNKLLKSPETSATPTKSSRKGADETPPSKAGTSLRKSERTQNKLLKSPETSTAATKSSRKTRDSTFVSTHM